MPIYPTHSIPLKVELKQKHVKKGKMKVKILFLGVINGTHSHPSTFWLTNLIDFFFFFLITTNLIDLITHR